MLALLAAFLLGLPACGDDDSADGRDEGVDDRERPGDRPASTMPLLGSVGEVYRPALAVKIDGTARGRPQTGLPQAGIVFEELVEGGLTRLLAVYHSQRPNAVGPVRSARSTDLFLLPEMGQPVFAWSGANPTFAAAVEASELIVAGLGALPGAYWRSDDRRAPYNLYARPGELVDRAPPCRSTWVEVLLPGSGEVL